MEQEDDESEFVVREIQNFLKEDHKPHELAVLYRSNAQGALIESGLRRAPKFPMPFQGDFHF